MRGDWMQAISLDGVLASGVWCLAAAFVGWRVLWRHKKPACHPAQSPPARAPDVMLGASLEKALSRARTARDRAANQK